MKRTMAFASRTLKEILRDPLTMAFGLGFPLVLLLLLSLIQANIPVEMFELNKLTPGITVFGLAFMTLFSAQLISHDRESALLTRLYTTPLRASDFILGYMLPVLPLSLVQSAICYLVAALLGLKLDLNILLAVLLNIIPALFYVGMGLLCGSAMTEKQVGGICGALLTNVSAWLSGIWFDVALLGGVFKAIAEALPFYHAVEMARAFAAGDAASGLPHMLIVLAWAVVVTLFAIRVFLRQMKRC